MCVLVLELGGKGVEVGLVALEGIIEEALTESPATLKGEVDPTKIQWTEPK